MTQTIETEKAVKQFNYKGSPHTIGALSVEEADTTGIACQAIELDVPLTTTSWNTAGGCKLPRLFVITNVRAYNSGSKYVTYQTYYKGKFTTKGNYIPDDFKIKKLTGKMGQSMLDQWGMFNVLNLARDLSVTMAVGSDPEIFVEDKDGQVVPAFNFLGSKAKPNYSRKASYGNKPVYWDGFQAEFETAAEQCLAWQVDSVQLGLEAVMNAAKAKYPDGGTKLSIKTVMDIPFDMLQNSAEEHVTFGCMPSLNAYGLEGNTVPARQLPFRSAGGHIHFGVGKLADDKVVEIVKTLDAILGVSCVSLFARFDNPARREFYGLPGEYRLPAHGIEYRVLSNAWLFHPLIMNLVFDLSRKVLAFGKKGLRKYWKATDEETINCIRTCDVAKAHEIMERNKSVFTSLLNSCYGYGADVAYNIFKNGLESAIKNPADIAGNWNLNGGWVSHSDGNGKNWRLSHDQLAAGGKV